MVIYMTTNLINGKKYIGRDSKNNPNYLGSGPLLKRSIRKYGKHNFEKKIIESCSSKEELIEREEYWLNYYDAGNDSNFYNMNNISSGGALFLGRKHSTESKKKIGDALRGENSPNWGTKHSEERKSKIGLSQIGKIITEENKKKISIAQTGRRASEKTKQKMRESKLGINNNMYGVRGEKSPSFKGYVVCIEGQYKGKIKTRLEWCDLLKIKPHYFSKHLHRKKYKNGIKGNFFKWEHEIQS